MNPPSIIDFSVSIGVLLRLDCLRRLPLTDGLPA